MRRFTILWIMTLVACMAWSTTVQWQPADVPDSTVTRMEQDPVTVNTAYNDSSALRMTIAAARIDSVRDKDHWKRVILRRGWSINDTTIAYPPVLDFGFKAYRWLNHALNYYDTAYVVNPGKTSGKKWKVMLKNNNWIDFYSGHLSKWDTPVQLNSDVTSLFGYQICGMGLSLTYMFNVRDLLAGKFIHNRRLQFSFTTSRVFIEAYYRKNDESTVHINRIGQ